MPNSPAFDHGGNLTRLLAPLVIALSVAGCSGTPAIQTTPPGAPVATTEAPPSPTVLPAGKFELDTKTGAKITFELPTPVTDPTLAKLEAYRKKTGGKPVTYVVADVDNRQGTEAAGIYHLDAFDKEGKRYTFSTVTDAIDLWQPTYGQGDVYRLPNGRALDDATGTSLNNEGVDLHNAHLHGVDKAERATLVLASTEVDLPKEFTRVSIRPSGLEEGQDAKPVAE